MIKILGLFALILTLSARGQDSVKPWRSGPIQYAIQYNWFPDANEITQAFYTKGFPCRIRDWQVTASNTMFLGGDDPSIFCNLHIQSLRKKEKDYFRYYEYRFSVSNTKDGLTIQYDRSPQEQKRIDSLINIEMKSFK